MVEFLSSEFVSPHLPSYYLPPTDICVQQQIIEGLQGRLEAVKGVHFAEMLSYRSVVLDAVVSKGRCTRMEDAMAAF